MSAPVSDGVSDSLEAAIPAIPRADLVASYHAAMIRRLMSARPDLTMRQASDMLELVEAAGLVLADAGPR